LVLALGACGKFSRRIGISIENQKVRLLAIASMMRTAVSRIVAPVAGTIANSGPGLAGACRSAKVLHGHVEGNLIGSDTKSFQKSSYLPCCDAPNKAATGPVGSRIDATA
jgi:hypothetical protein